MEAIYLQSSLQFGETLKSVSDSDYRRLRDNYDALLKQHLKLGFFVPCDENGNVLDPSDAFKSCEKGFLYGKAKERVLFKGFEYIKTDHNFYIFNESELIRLDQSHFHGTVTIEYISAKNVELTESAIKTTRTMKPQFKREEIYLDLSKLSEEQQGKVISILPEPINKDDYDITYLHFYLIYDDEDCMWWVSTKYFLAEKTELTYSQFLDMMGESEEKSKVIENSEKELINNDGTLYIGEGLENYYKDQLERTGKFKVASIDATSEEVLQVENYISIEELTKLCNDYNRNTLKITNLERDLEYKRSWSKESIAIKEIHKEVSHAQAIKENAKSKLQEIGIVF